MLTVVALYTLLFSTSFCLKSTFAYSISSSSPSYSSSLKLLPSSAPSTANVSQPPSHHGGRNITAAKGYEETTTHHIGIFVTSFSTSRRTMSSATTADDDDNEQFISSAREFQIGFRKFLHFFKADVDKFYQIDFLDYQGNYFFPAFI